MHASLANCDGLDEHRLGSPTVSGDAMIIPYVRGDIEMLLWERIVAAPVKRP